MTKDAFNALLIDARHLALDIGLNPAARAMGINPDRMRKWASRGKWGISLHHPFGFKHPTISHEVTSAIEAKKRILAQHRDRTQLGMAQSATKVFEHLAERPASALCAPASAIAAQQWSKVADTTHGYTAERAQSAQVNVAVVAMPGAEDRALREAMHARLDDIARQLKRAID